MARGSPTMVIVASLINTGPDQNLGIEAYKSQSLMCTAEVHTPVTNPYNHEESLQIKGVIAMNLCRSDLGVCTWLSAVRNYVQNS